MRSGLSVLVHPPAMRRDRGDEEHTDYMDFKRSQQWDWLVKVMRGLRASVQTVKCSKCGDYRHGGNQDSQSFIQDVAYVLETSQGPKVLLASMGYRGRREEPEWHASVFQQIGEIIRFPEGATFEGGDVITADQKLFVGAGKDCRTNEQGFEFFREVVERYGFQAIRTETTGKPHLSTVASYVGRSSQTRPTMIVNRQEVDVDTFTQEGFEFVEAASDELFSANALVVANVVILDGEAEELKNRGFKVKRIHLGFWRDANEGHEAGPTCLTNIVNPSARFH